MEQRNEKAIFLIPFAGGNAYSLQGLAKELQGVDTYAIELPGRGKRLMEDLLTDINEMVEDLYLKIEPIKQKYSEYFIYGHSMGSLLGYLLIQKIVTKGEQPPGHFFVSGRGGPSKPPKEKNSHLLPSDEFRDMLRELGGCPEEVLNDEDLMDFFEPILRADFQSIEACQYTGSIFNDISITGFFGSEEETKMQDMELWQLESLHPVEIIEYPGNHFFIYNYWKEMADKILSKTLGPARVV